MAYFCLVNSRMDLDKEIPTAPKVSKEAAPPINYDGYSIPRGTYNADIEKLRNSVRMSTASQQSTPSIIIETASNHEDRSPFTPQHSRISIPGAHYASTPLSSGKHDSDLLEKQLSSSTKTHYRSLLIAITLALLIICGMALVLLLLFY
ncbi:hypothetical protein WR25_03871 [Diploscapter pachys]|uniref:Uncharacterized protein n=1 Tax=Diploscapter pachys TaxID=2018661 RepID=A0A2A2JN94_9BILA|nr:hypothetical protein WR25_03871 [Diploscapter pachys]